MTLVSRVFYNTYMSVRAKITAYNNNAASTDGCSDFSMNMFWGDNYKNVFYLCGDLGRSEFIDTIETEVDVTGIAERTQNTSVERYNISIIAISPLLSFLKTIDKCDIKTIEFIDTGDIYTIQNIDIEDTGDVLTPTNLVYIKFEDEAISKTSDIVYVKDAEKQAFWDNNNDGVKDIDGEAAYNPTVDFFRSYQLYYESDGVTPATSGDVLLLVYAVNPESTSTNTIESLVGIFRGEFGDSYSDATKWQSTQQIWDYFDVNSVVEHRTGAGIIGAVSFDKRAFAEDNGYLSSEVEDRAVDLRFDLSIDSSGQEPTTLSRVYSAVGAFQSSRTQNPTNGSYGVTTIGHIGRKNTLSTVQDVKLNLGGGAAIGPITAFTLTSVTPYSNEYLISVAPTGENSYDGSFTTKGGYIGSYFRMGRSNDNFVLTLDDARPIISNENVLNFTIGSSPLVFEFSWKYERNVTAGGYPNSGDITAGGAAVVNVDSVLLNTLPTILPSPGPAIVTGNQSITLPDTGVHVIELTFPTSQAYDLYTEFEVQIVPLF